MPFVLSQLKAEVLREPVSVACDLLVEPLGGNTVKGGQIGIQDHRMPPDTGIRYIQQLLGHEKLETTAIYTEVNIIQLQADHTRCHPAERHRNVDKSASHPAPADV